MTTERFSKKQFMDALPESACEHGFDKGEWTFRIELGNDYVIEIRSSIGYDGYAKDTGDDSIRCYILDTRNNKGVGKTSRTNRTPGWQKRLQEKLQELIERGQNLTRITCPKCKADMVLRNGKYGEFYGCSNYPRCKNTMRKNQVKKVAPKVEARQSDMSDLLDEVTQTKKPQSDFVPSKYQQAIFEFVKNGKGNAVIEAVAGSGKTTTIIKALEFTPKNESVAFVAFNKRIAIELQKRAPKHVHVSTLHSLGYKNIRASFGKTKVEPGKIRWIIKDELENMPSRFRDIIKDNMSATIRLVSLCKATLLEPTTESLDYLSDNYNVNTNGEWQTIYRMVRIAFEKSIAQTWRIDYDDMIYFCAIGKVQCQTFDWFFVDECQDLNAAQQKFVLNSIHEKSRVIAVGDRNQSIYAFRGADTQAVPNLIENLDAQTLPLSITYRCPKSHVKLAQTLVPEITAWENAKEGIIENVTSAQFLSKVKVNDLVLCRTNAPLVKPAFELIRRGIKAVILGRDIGKGLVDLIEKMEKKTAISNISELIYTLSEYRRREVTKLMLQKKESKAQHLDDSVETIFAFAEGCNHISILKDRINSVFSDESKGVVFSSIHKSKGMEAERVFILHDELMPHPMALKSKNPEALQQENNIRYVAYTRSKSEMYFVQ